MPQDNFRKLYDNVKQAYDLPDFDTFKKDMENEDNLRKFHTNLEKEYELPDFDTFKSDMGLKKKETFGLGFGTASDASALTRPQAKVPFKSPSGSALEGIKGVKGDKPKAVIRPKSIVPIKEQASLPTENVPYKEDLQKRINVLNEKFGTDYDVEGALAEMDAPDIGTAEAAGRGFLSGINSVFAATLNTPEYLRRVLTNPIMELAGMSEEGKQLFFDTQANNPVDPLYALNKISDIYKKDSEALVKPLEGKFDKDFMAQYEEGDYLGAAKQIGVDLAKSLPTTLAISMATAAGVPMSAMTPVGSLVFASQEYQSADPNSPMTETQKQTNSFLKGFSEQFFENLGTSQITKQALNLIKKEGADKAKSIIANQYATAAKESLKPYFALTAPLQEGLTEAATALAQNVIDKYTDPSKENINILQDVPKSFVMGAAMGTAFGAAPTIVNTAYSIKGKAAAKEAQEKITAIEQDLDNPKLGDNAKKILVEERAKALIEVNNVLEQEVEAVANLPEQQKEAVIEAQNQIADIDKALADETVSEPTKAAFEEKKTQIEQEIDAIITEQETEETPSSETVTDTIVSDGSATPTTVEGEEVKIEKEKPKFETDVQRETVSDNKSQETSDIRNEEIANELQSRVRKAYKDAGYSEADGKKYDLREIDNKTAYDYAKETDTWIGDFDKLGKSFIGGQENRTVVNNEEQKIYKSNNLSNVGSLDKFFDKIRLHNQLFPDTKYTFEGFAGVEDMGGGRAYVEPVYSQDFISNAENATPQEIDSYMTEMGFEKTKDFTYTKDGVEVSDVRPRNVIKDANGDFYVIDAEFKEVTTPEKKVSESARKSENIEVSEREKEIQLLDTKKKIAQLEKELRKAPLRPSKGKASQKQLRTQIRNYRDQLRELEGKPPRFKPKGSVLTRAIGRFQSEVNEGSLSNEERRVLDLIGRVSESDKDVMGIDQKQVANQKQKGVIVKDGLTIDQVVTDFISENELSEDMAQDLRDYAIDFLSKRDAYEFMKEIKERESTPDPDALRDDEYYGYGYQLAEDLDMTVEEQDLLESEVAEILLSGKQLTDKQYAELQAQFAEEIESIRSGQETIDKSDDTKKGKGDKIQEDVEIFEQVLTINDTTKLKSSKKAKIKEVIESKADNDIISYIAENIDDIKAQLRDKVGLTTECKW